MLIKTTNIVAGCHNKCKSSLVLPLAAKGIIRVRNGDDKVIVQASSEDILKNDWNGTCVVLGITTKVDSDSNIKLKLVR
jgi:hypothetical protein